MKILSKYIIMISSIIRFLKNTVCHKLHSACISTISGCCSNHLSQWQMIVQASKSQSGYDMGSSQENLTRSLFLIRVLFIQSPYGPCY